MKNVKIKHCVRKINTLIPKYYKVSNKAKTDFFIISCQVDVFT